MTDPDRALCGGYSGIDPAKPGSEKNVASVWVRGEIVVSYDGPHSLLQAMAFEDGYNKHLALTDARATLTK